MIPNDRKCLWSAIHQNQNQIPNPFPVLPRDGWHTHPVALLGVPMAHWPIRTPHLLDRCQPNEQLNEAVNGSTFRYKEIVAGVGFFQQKLVIQS